MEIRRSVYQGEFALLLQELNENEDWRSIIARPKIDKRLRDVELILRIVALQQDWKNYEKPMKTFLNGFMAKINKMPEVERKVLLENVRTNFEWAVGLLNDQLGEKPFHIRGPMNYAVLDSVYNAVASCKKEPEDLAQKFDELISNVDYLSAVSVSTSDEKVIKIRFEEAIKHLSGD
jgi:hypothetical protein